MSLIAHQLHTISHDVTSSNKNPELAPLYPGYGTHYAYFYIGNPPQRQSLIIDTGSHYTAFPCAGCTDCGAHNDNYFQVTNSSTATVLQCGNSLCYISQSYAEGSMWSAYQVEDYVYLSGRGDYVVAAHDYSMRFQFACQDHETGRQR
jgi:hypothetical protein